MYPSKKSQNTFFYWQLPLHCGVKVWRFESHSKFPWACCMLCAIACCNMLVLFFYLNWFALSRLLRFDGNQIFECFRLHFNILCTLQEQLPLCHLGRWVLVSIGDQSTHWQYCWFSHGSWWSGVLMVRLACAGWGNVTWCPSPFSFVANARVYISMQSVAWKFFYQQIKARQRGDHITSTSNEMLMQGCIARFRGTGLGADRVARVQNLVRIVISSSSRTTGTIQDKSFTYVTEPT